MTPEDLLATLGLAASSAAPFAFASITAVHADGSALVTLHGRTDAPALAAHSLVALRAEDAGREALVAFVGAAPPRPVVLGLLRGAATQPPVSLAEDGERLVIRGDREIVLQCGKASITLTRAGKVLIRGAYVLSRSSGANRIKGGSVQIN